MINLKLSLEAKGRHSVKRLGFPFLIIVVGTFFIVTLCFAGLSGSLDEKQILLRIKPEGEVTIEATGTEVSTPPVKTITDIGQQRYEEFCHTCHATGLAGAPKFGDKAEWAPRLAEGVETLIKHAIQGYKAMPPKGSCINCTDEEIKKAVEYMVLKAK